MKTLNLRNTMKGTNAQYEAIINKIDSPEQTITELEHLMQLAKPELGLFMNKGMVKLPVQVVTPLDANYNEVGAHWWVKCYEPKNGLENWYINAADLVTVLSANDTEIDNQYINENFLTLEDFTTYIRKLQDGITASTLTASITRLVQRRDRQEIDGDILLVDADDWKGQHTNFIRELVSDLIVYAVYGGSVRTLSEVIDDLAEQVLQRLDEVQPGIVSTLILVRLVLNALVERVA